MSNPLLALHRLGQSPWHDNIRRELITSGKLRKMIEDGDITGLTSNPTIFEQAIGQSDDYDDDLVRMARAGKSAGEIFDELACDDVRNACDLFTPVYERTAGKDGFCSIEVTPKFARDTRATITEAQRLWKKVDRPNLMVKIPATREGIPAIEDSIAAGLNINVTLIFSLERYDEVMNAYLTGLIRRVREGKPVDRIGSVASFFVSRVDTLVDKLLDEKIARGDGDVERMKGLKGKAAIANAKLAYQAFRRKFSTEAYGGVAAQGASVQRPLWASTSTKNPAYPDVYYVEALVGSDTVDTMPPATIVAYKDHGRPELRIEQDLDGARRVMVDLSQVGIDMDAVTKKLEEDGVASFAKSFDSLLATVEERRAKAVATTTATSTARAAAPRVKKPRAKAAPKRRPAKAPRAARKLPVKKRRQAAKKARQAATKAGKKVLKKRPRQSASKGLTTARKGIVKSGRKRRR
jgi:transaldolase